MTILTILNKIQNDAELGISEIKHVNNTYLIRSEIFHNIDRKEAEKILGDKPNGSWLLRKSSKDKKFVMQKVTTSNTLESPHVFSNYLFMQDKKFIYYYDETTNVSTLIGSLLDFFLFIQELIGVDLRKVVVNAIHVNQYVSISELLNHRHTVVFDFDLTLTTVHYYNFKMAIENGKSWCDHPKPEINKILIELLMMGKGLNCLDKRTSIEAFFGGEKRFLLLKNTLTSLKSKNYKLIISSRNYHEWINELLVKVELSDMFDSIHGNEIPKIAVIEYLLPQGKVTYIDDVHEEHKVLLKRHSFAPDVLINSYITKFTNHLGYNYNFSEKFTSSCGLTEKNLDELFYL